MSDSTDGTIKTKRYIKKAHIENFQDHKDTTVTFTPGINIITGSSDVGKSALLRGLNFALHNQPKNNSFIHCGEKEARVALWFSDNHVVHRIKGDRNIVHITYPDGEERVCEKIGSSLPKEALEALGNPPIIDSHGPVSYAEQMGNLFIVSLTSTEIPRVLSDLTGISDYEEAVKNLQSSANSAAKEAKSSEARVQRIEQSLEEYNDVPIKLKRLAQLKLDAKEIDDLGDLLNLGNNLLFKKNQLMQQARSLKSQIDRAKLIMSYSNEFDELEKLNTKISLANSLLNKYKLFESQRESQVKKLKNIKIFFNDENTEIFSRLDELNSKCDLAQELVSKLNKLNQKQDKYQSEIKVWTSKLQDCDKELEKLKKHMKKNNLWCDKCDRPLMEDNCGIK